MAQKPETRFRTSKVRPALKKLPNTAIFPIQQAGISGDPDFLLCINGLFVGLELKGSSADKPRPLQKHKLQNINDAGGIGIVANPQNWPEVLAFLQTLANGGRKFPINLPTIEGAFI